jgi:NADPH-dependent 2,4-dienoyl-CoA reductase/sulfur reductase-like enzyme
MTAGAAQGLLKSSGMVASGRVVFAGSGPLLWLAAGQYVKAGARIEAILDTTPRKNRTRALPHLPAFLFSSYAREGLALVRDLKRSVRVIAGVESLAALGSDGVNEVVYGSGGAESRIAAELLFVHHGVTPNVNLAMAAGVDHAWDDVQRCWAPVLDRDGNTSIEGIAIAGDGAGIAGAKAAEFRGTLAALAALRALGAQGGENAEHTARSGLAHALRGRAFIDALYAPARAFRAPSGDTIVCRCEEVTARTIIETVALGCPGPNQMKAFLRCGMGPCQGRLCGLTVTELIAEARGVPPRDVGYYRLRPPVKPITVAELAAMSADETEPKATR